MLKDVLRRKWFCGQRTERQRRHTQKKSLITSTRVHLDEQVWLHWKKWAQMISHMLRGRLCFFFLVYISTHSSSGQSPSCVTTATYFCFGFLFFFFNCTLVAPPVFDDNGPPAASLLLGLGHALTSFVVRVIRGVNRHLLLNHAKAWQLLGSTDGGEGGGGKKENNNLTRTVCTCSCSALIKEKLSACWSRMTLQIQGATPALSFYIFF